MGGVSVLFVECGPGVSTREMDCQGGHGSGTAYITFEDVKVPVENLIGKENAGFKVIMTNFNHERLGIVIQCTRFCRVLYEGSMEYANRRRTFGKKLIEHPVIVWLKLAHMGRQIEATHNWLEDIVYQSLCMGDTEAMLKLGGAIAGLKAQSTTTFEFCVREATQIFGGIGYTKGVGAKVERLYRDVQGYSIPGGSEEIMFDLSIRQSLKVHQTLGMKL